MTRPIIPVALLAAVAVFSFSCAGKPPAPEPEPAAPEATTAASEAVADQVPESAPEPKSEPEAVAEAPAPVPAEPSFDPSAVSEAVKTAAFEDIRALIDNLNKTIQRQDYMTWLTNLTPEYVAYYSDPVLLAQYSEYPILKRQGVKLSTLKDYFVYLVYPSRQNDRVDDIEYVSENLVKAITVSPKGSRDILYILEKHGDTWKIGIGR